MVGEKEAPVEGGEVDPSLVEEGGEPTTDPTVEPTDEPTGDPTTPAAPPAAGTAQERLDTALQDAKTAIEESNAAMESGDWAAYGEAQDALSDAIDRAVAAQQELDGN